MAEKRLIDYNEISRLFDAKYKETAQLIRDGEIHLDNLAEGFTEAARIIQQIPTVDAVEVVRCRDCEIHGHCATEDVFYFAGISNPFCCAGKRKDGDGYGNCLVHHGADLRGDPDGGGIEHHCQRENQP